MTERDLSSEWARSQIEAWADGSLPRASRKRMATALRADPALRAAAERAVAVYRALGEVQTTDFPAGLRGRLLAIGARPVERWRRFALPLAASAVLTLVLLRPEPVPPPDARSVAMHEFEVAMRYLQKSARITQNEVTSAVGTGLREAFATSSEALGREIDETGG